MTEKEESAVERINQFLTKFLASPWVIVFHGFLIGAWLIFRFNLEILTLAISLEAIFIWVISLSASKKREEKKDRIDALQQIKIKEKVIDTLANGEKQNTKLDQITKMLYELSEEVKTLKKKSLR